MGIFGDLLENLFDLAVKGTKTAIKSGQGAMKEISEISSSYEGWDEYSLKDAYRSAVRKNNFKEMVAIRNRLSRDFNYSNEDFENI